jgi:hypothetical protein
MRPVPRLSVDAAMLNVINFAAVVPKFVAKK